MAKLIVNKEMTPLILLITITTKKTHLNTLVNLENKLVYVKSSDTGAFTIILGNYEKQNDLTLLIDWSNQKLINFTKIYKQLGAEKVKTQISFHCFSSSDTAEQFTGKSKETRTKSFLNSDVFELFQLIPRHINTEIMQNLEVFAAKVYS